MADIQYRRRVGEYEYGHTCPKCGQLKGVQASVCRECHEDRLRGPAYWARRTCPNCGGAKSSKAAGCKPCANKRLIGNTHAVGRKAGGWSKQFRIQPWRVSWLLVLALFVFASPAQAREGRVPPDVFKAVRHYWRLPAQRVKAFDVVSCETGGRYNTTARNGQYLGLFQAGSWFRSRYGHGYTADAQARAAHLGWLELGWSQWECA